MRRDRQNDQNGAPAAVLTQTPSSTEDAFAVLPQNLTAALLIAFAGKWGKRKAADGERTAIAHSQGRADHLWRNRHFAYAAVEEELGSLELQKFCTRVIANFASPVSLHAPTRGNPGRETMFSFSAFSFSAKFPRQRHV